MGCKAGKTFFYSTQPHTGYSFLAYFTETTSFHVIFWAKPVDLSWQQGCFVIFSVSSKKDGKKDVDFNDAFIQE